MLNHWEQCEEAYKDGYNDGYAKAIDDLEFKAAQFDISSEIHAGTLHGYTCGTCQWGRDTGKDYREYTEHKKESGHDGD